MNNCIVIIMFIIAVMIIVMLMKPNRFYRKRGGAFEPPRAFNTLSRCHNPRDGYNNGCIGYRDYIVDELSAGTEDSTITQADVPTCVSGLCTSKRYLDELKEVVADWGGDRILPLMSDKTTSQVIDVLNMSPDSYPLHSPLSPRPPNVAAWPQPNEELRAELRQYLDSIEVNRRDQHRLIEDGCEDIDMLRTLSRDDLEFSGISENSIVKILFDRSIQREQESSSSGSWVRDVPKKRI